MTAALNLRARVDWSGLHEALARAEDAGYAPAFWWRDDDAARHTPALDRLLALSRRFGVPVALAAIPARLEPSLAMRLADESLATVLVHGRSHANHAPPGAKKAEFGPHRPVAAMVDEARGSLTMACAARLPVARVFVPPWNRVAAEVVAALPRAGYLGLSTFGDRAAALAAPGLVQVNVHVDPIAWRGDRGLRDGAMLAAALAAAVTDRTERRADRGEAVGLLTHHLAHGEAVWSFCEEFLEQVSRREGMRFPATRVLFESETEGRSECSVTHDG